MPDVEYTRKFSICKGFASDGGCTRQECIYSHTLLDARRITALVGDITSSSQASLAAEQEKVYFLVEYTKYSTLSDSADPDETKWRMKLVGGGRATLLSEGLGTDASRGSLTFQPSYPLKGQAREAGVAMATLEKRVFGQIHPPDMERRTVCKQYLNQCCRVGQACKYSHSLFDTQRIESLIEEAVRERGYKDYRPLVEIEYLRPSSRADPMWRVTLRCVVGGYQDKGSPQPVIATGADLNLTFSLVERQFAAASGKPQEQAQRAPQTNSSGHRRHSTAPPRPSRGHGRRPSAPNNTPRPSQSTAHTSFPDSPPQHDAPPSYHDAMRGNFSPSSSHDAKRRL